MARSDSPRTQESRSAETRAKLIAAATDLFFEQGYDATTVQQVVDRAGVTKGAYYHHFDAKQDLLYSLYGEVFAEELADMERIIALGRDPAWTLREVIRSIVVGTAGAGRSSVVITREMNRLDEARHQALQAAWRRYQDSVRDVIAKGQAEGVFAGNTSPQVASWSIFGLTNSMHTWFDPAGPKTAEDIARELADLIVPGLRSGAGEEGS